MSSILVDVAAAITAELAGVTLSETFEPLRSYADWNDVLDDFDGLRVDVVPAMCPTVLFSRGKLQYACTVHVMLRKKIGHVDRSYNSGKLDLDAIDTLVADMQTIHEFFAPSQPSQSGRQLTDIPTASWSPDSGIKAPYSRKMLKEHSQFSGFLSVVYNVPRAAGS